MAALVPHLGDPVDVQRRLEFSLASELEWTALCYLDLETLKERVDDEPAPTIVDFKVKGSLIGQDGRLGPAGRDLPRRALARGLPGQRAAVRADRQARQAPQADGRVAGSDRPDTGPDARRARPRCARGQPNRRLVRTL